MKRFFFSRAGKLRVGQLRSRAAGGVPALPVVGLSVHVGVRTQRDRAQGPAAADVQRRGRAGHGRVFGVGQRGRVATACAATAPAAAAAASALRARAVRGQRVPAQGAIQDRVVRAEPLAAQLGRHAAHGPADGRRLRVPVSRRRQPVPARAAGVQRRGRLPRFPVKRRVAGHVRPLGRRVRRGRVRRRYRRRR